MQHILDGQEAARHKKLKPGQHALRPSLDRRSWKSRPCRSINTERMSQRVTLPALWRAIFEFITEWLRNRTGTGNRNRQNRFSRNRKRNRNRRNLFPGTETGTVLSFKNVLKHRKTLCVEEPPEPKTGTDRTFPRPNRNRTESNRGHSVIRCASVRPRPIFVTGKSLDSPDKRECRQNVRKTSKNVRKIVYREAESTIFGHFFDNFCLCWPECAGNLKG